MHSQAPMVDRKKMETIFFAALDEVNRLLPPERKVGPSLDTVLLGADSELDSLGLVNLVVALEQRIDDGFGVAVALVNKDSMSRVDSPFRNGAALVEYAAELVEKQQA